MTFAKVAYEHSQKQKFIRKLSRLLPPFDRFVAKGELPEQDPVFPSRENILRKIAEEIQRDQSVLIPVVGSVGAGKTHFLWGIYNSFDIDANSAFLSFPRSKEKFLYYLYSNFIKQYGQNNLRDFTQNFGEKFGAAEKLYGLFRTQNSDQISQSAINQLEDDYDRASLEQCVNVTIQHMMNNDKSQVAERWLLGQLMDIEELDLLGAYEDLSKEIMAKTMMKLIVEHTEQDTVFLFDDLDKAATEFDSLEEYFDPDDDVNWAGDLGETENVEEFALIEELLQLMRDIKKLKFVVTLGQDESERCIEWLKKKQVDPTIYIADPIFLSTITINDTNHLYFSRMKNFCLKYDVDHPTADRSFKPERDLDEYLQVYGENLYFPLSENIIKDIFEISDKNPRKILRNFKRIFDAIIFEEIKIDEIESEYRRFLQK